MCLSASECECMIARVFGYNHTCMFVVVVCVLPAWLWLHLCVFDRVCQSVWLYVCECAVLVRVCLPVRVCLCVYVLVRLTVYNLGVCVCVLVCDIRTVGIL